MKLNLATAALSAVLAASVSLSACGGPGGTKSATPTVEQSTSASGPADSPNSATPYIKAAQPIPATTQNTRSPIVEKEVVVHASEVSPSGELPKNLTSSVEQPLKMVAEPAASYWAADWCHYFIGYDGITYGDTCVRSKPDASGGALPNQFLIYRYDPTATGFLGQALLEIFIGYPGYTAYRDLTDPQFNLIAWIAFPTGSQATVDNSLVSVFDASSQLVWYQVSDLVGHQVYTTGLAQNYPLAVPALDSSITVTNYGALSNIWHVPTGVGG